MNVRWRPAYVGIGSNLDSPEDRVRAAIEVLRSIPDTRLMNRSSLYRSAPMGPADQPDFVNAVAALLTRLEPSSLLAELQAVEDAHGRQRSAERWGPRTLDLDLLSYAHTVCDTDDLELPHPGIAERIFVLLPLNEIAPQMAVPGLTTVANLLARLPAEGGKIEKL